MSAKPSDGIGERLAYYRKLAGVSAQTLSDRLGGSLSRGVIANIENGRKKDITLDDIVGLAWALDIPVVALALPLDRPLQFVSTVDSDTSTQYVRVFEVAEWFQTGNRRREVGQQANPAQVLAQTRMQYITDYSHQLRRISRASRMIGSGNTDSDWQAILGETRLAQDDTIKKLAGLGVDMTAERIGEEHTPGLEIRPAKYDLFKDRTGEYWRFNLVDEKGEVIASSEAYESREAAMRGIETMRNAPANAQVNT